MIFADRRRDGRGACPPIASKHGDAAFLTCLRHTLILGGEVSRRTRRGRERRRGGVGDERRLVGVRVTSTKKSEDSTYSNPVYLSPNTAVLSWHKGIALYGLVSGNEGDKGSGREEN
jgi:hypothetical protein